MRSALVVLLALVAACPVGPRAEQFPPARSPYGIRADLRLLGRTKTRLAGELLEFRDSMLLLLREGASPRVTEIPISAIREGTFAKQGLLIVEGRMSRGDRVKLRLMSRFPGGLRPELAAQLLAEYGQTEPERVGQRE